MDEKVIIGKGTKYPLDGILSLPENLSKKVPAVVLIQGSGPSDKDETIMANKPFRDVSEYLVSKGIAVLRYDKRTFVYGKQILKEADYSKITVEQETIEDAILATAILKNDARIDANKVYILGHSMGGMLAPRIDAEGGNFAGIIILAGSPRNLTDIMLSQVEDLIGQLGKLLRIIAVKQTAGIKKKFEAIPDMTVEQAQKTKSFGKTYAWYFKEMNEHPATGYLSVIKKPVLILQGEKDFQVSVEKDFNLYKQILSDKPNVTFKLYPGLNHLFMKSVYGTVKEYKKEYKIPSKVDTNVLLDMAQWILKE
jgi:dienelactone hydrolase